MMASPRGAELAYQQHDHHHCMADALTAATAVCSERGVRLTPLRQKVLALIWQTHKPLGAYAILDQLGSAAGSDGRRPAPPTVYRALEFLLEQGLVHRINTLNAFVGCRLPRRSHAGHFLICRGCTTALEIEDDAIAQALDQAAVGAGFQIEQAAVEIMGLCPNCQHPSGEDPNHRDACHQSSDHQPGTADKTAARERPSR